MKREVLFIISVIISFQIYSQCASDKTRVLIMGDSWAAFTWQYNAHDISFDKYGFSDVKSFSTGSSVSVTGSSDLCQSGVAARVYLTPAKKTSIVNAFTNNPDIEIVHISLGGNDFLNQWDTSWTQLQEDALTQEVLDSITSIIAFVRQQKSNVKVLLATYDYPNFEEAIGGSTIHPEYGRWNAMKKPSFSQLNNLLIEFNTKLVNYVQAGTELYFVNNMGQMQYYFGQTYLLPYPPGGSYPPLSAPLPGGYPDYPSPIASMNSVLTVKDAFHLNSAGYKYLVDNQTKEFYFNALRNYDATTPNEGLKSGYVTSAKTSANFSIIVGNLNNNRYHGLLSFKVPALDSTRSVGSASIFLRRKALVGANPISSHSLVMDIQIGTLGTTAFPDTSDFTAAAGITFTTCPVGSVSSDKYWMRIDMPQSVAQLLTANQTYQCRIHFVGDTAMSNQALEFYSDASAPNAPFLDIQYVPANPASLADYKNTFEQKELMVYPNPVFANECAILFKTPFAGTLEVVDILGNKIIETSIQDNTLTSNLKFRELPNGVYFLTAKNKKTNEVFLQKFVVEKL